jgi:hypothetical protein
VCRTGELAIDYFVKVLWIADVGWLQVVPPQIGPAENPRDITICITVFKARNPDITEF